MRYRTRLRLLAAPFVAAVVARAPRARAQANTNTPTSGPNKEGTGEVQVGAGTQGDVTSGSSGPQKRKPKAGMPPDPHAARDASKQGMPHARKDAKPQGPANADGGTNARGG
jgi:hypothetical protein